MSAPVRDAALAQGLMQPEVLAGLANLDLIARAVAEGVLNGLHRSPLFGFSQEFAEYRPYTPGDDPRFVDWNVYARTGRTYIKRFLGETNSHLVILLDASASMAFGTSTPNKFRYAQMLAATLAYVAARQHDAVGLVIFDEDVREYRAPSGRRGHVQALLHAIDAARPSERTNLKRPLERFRDYGVRRGLVAVISDFYCDPAVMLDSVHPLAFQGQDVALFQVLDREELAPQLSEATVLEDMETHESVEVSPDFAQREYPQRVRAHIAALREAARSIGADHVLLETTTPLHQALRDYLLFREHRR
jgi:uncharacterized protein (DUF58 family)